MEKQTFSYVDGTWGISEGTYVDIHNNHDSSIRDWSKPDYLEIFGKGTGTLKIPKTHIVDVEFITDEIIANKSILKRSLTGLAITGGMVVGASAVLGLSPFVLLGAGLGIGKFALSGRCSRCIIQYRQKEAEI